MKRQFNKAVAVATSAALLLSSAMPVFGAERAIDRFTDVKGHWAVSDLSSMAERGIMGGYPDNTMRPQQTVTMAESVKLINKALELKGSGDVSVIKYSDVKKDAWYSGEIAIAIENGYLSKVAPGEKLNPNAPATREQLSSMFAQAMELKAKDLTSLDKFKDSAKISASFKADMAAAVEKGLFGGYEDETIRPSEKVIRATMAAVTNRTILERELESNQGIVLGANDMLVDSNGVTVSGKTVDTLWIAPVKGTGVIVLENINAKKVVVMGENTQIEIKSTTAAVKERRAKVADILSFIGELEIRVPNAKISVGKGATIKLLTLKPEAAKAVIVGAGTVEKVVIGADNVKFEIVGAKFEVLKAVVGAVINGQSVAGNTTGSVTTDGIKKDSTGGGGGGGGGVAPTPVKNTYAFVAAKDGSEVNIVEKQYYGTDKMSFAAVSGVYSAVGALDSATIDSHVAKAMPTVEEILNLENESHVKYVKVLDDTIKAYAGNDLAVFTKGGTAAGYISEIADGTDVDTNMNALTKALLKSSLDSILTDLGKLFPSSKIPSGITIRVIDANGDLEQISNDTLLSAAKSTIDSKLGAVTFEKATGKTVVEIGANGKTISLKVKKMS